MFKQKGAAASILLGLLVPFYPQVSLADGFKSSDVLGWNRENQSFYFQTSVFMAGVIAAQNDSRQSQCIDNWHPGDDSGRDDAILKAMRSYPDHHPQAVILAVLQKACGSFKYLSR